MCVGDLGLGTMSLGTQDGQPVDSSGPNIFPRSQAFTAGNPSHASPASPFPGTLSLVLPPPQGGPFAPHPPWINPQLLALGCLLLSFAESFIAAE